MAESGSRSTLFASDRQFQCWLYTVGHGTLLLRSPPDEANATQVDVVFVNVGYMQLPTRLQVLELSRGDARDLGAGAPATHAQTVFRVCDRKGGKVGAILAGAFHFQEWRGTHSDRSPLIPAFMQP